MPESRRHEPSLPPHDSRKAHGILFTDEKKDTDSNVLEVTFRLLPVEESGPGTSEQRDPDDWTTYCTLCDAEVSIRADGRCPLGHHLA
jgi:hypothetical protein